MHKMMVVDEYHRVFDGEALKDRVLAVEGVPLRAYVVEDGRVFVFAKLVALVKERADLVQAGPLPRDAVLALARSAWVFPREAVRDWGIVPVPYAVEERSGTFVIRHEPFSALVPGAYATADLTHGALERLLLGQVVRGEGDFAWRHQPLVLIESPDPSTLPMHPAVDVDTRTAEVLPYSSLDGVEFEEGFAPIGRDTFERTKALVAAWGATETAVRHRMHERAGELWTALGAFPLTELNDPRDAVGGDQDSELETLRSGYPELAALSDASLQEQFSSFRTERHGAMMAPGVRDDGFLFHLLGQLVPGQPDSTYAGEAVAYAFARDGDAAGALAFGAAWARYATALGRIEQRTFVAMRFLREHRATPSGWGSPVVTHPMWLSATMRVGRKASVAVEQSLGDFS